MTTLAVADVDERKQNVIRATGPTILHLNSIVGPLMSDKIREVLVNRVDHAFQNNGVALADVARASAMMAAPEVLARIKRPNDVLAEFSAMLIQARDRRRNEAELKRLREIDETFRRAAADTSQEAEANRALVLELLSGIGKRVGPNKRPTTGEPHGDDEGESKGARESSGQGQAQAQEGGQQTGRKGRKQKASR